MKVRDLAVQPPKRQVLRCHHCHRLKPANRGSWWDVSDDYEIKCCGKPMELVQYDDYNDWDEW